MLDNIYFDKYRGIDYSLANGEVPARVQDLPLLVKQVNSFNRVDV